MLSGLWHGANWTFVLWGAYNGLFLVFDRIFWLKFSAPLPRWLSVAITLFLVMLGWVIFRSTHIEQAHYYLKALFNPTLTTKTFIDITPDIITAILIGAFISLGALTPGFNRINNAYLAWKWRGALEGILFGILGFFVICHIVGVTFNPFLYFRF